MSLLLFTRKAVAGWCLAVAAPGVLPAQTNYATNGTEYAITAPALGDQVHPRLALNTKGGYLVWEDNITDGSGLGVSAQRLDSSFSPTLSSFRVNQIGANDQCRPQVSLLNDGSAAFVWQGGKQGFEHIYARFLSASNIWTTGDMQVNTFSNNFQINPVLATLANGNLIVIWASYNQASANSLQDIYGQILTPAGQKQGAEFRLNQFTSFNQRNPAVAALANGQFVAVWVSEQERVPDVAGTTNGALYSSVSVDIYARIFNTNGSAATSEFLVNTSSSLCSEPAVAAAADGSFMVTWVESVRMPTVYGLDVWARSFSSAGVGGTVRCVNSTRQGDQYLPTISFDGNNYMVAWTSLGQDGSQEGVFAQFLQTDGTPLGGEFQVNTTWLSRQIQPVVASDRNGRFLAAWSSFTGLATGFDLFAQRYAYLAEPLPPMDAPFVSVPFVTISNIYQPQLQVAWPAQAGFAVDHYEVYVDGAAAPTASVQTNFWLMTAANGLTAGSTHSFQVLFVTTSGARSPLSAATSAATWSGNNNWGGIPSDWMTAYYGYDMSLWPRPTAPLAPGGPTLLQVFLSGGDPLDPSTWLRVSLASTSQGFFLNWNPQPGLIYQVQTTTNFGTWVNVGSPRLAAGTVDSLYVGTGKMGYFRVLLNTRL
jgi:hypothetical protein